MRRLHTEHTCRRCVAPQGGGTSPESGGPPQGGGPHLRAGNLTCTPGRLPGLHTTHGALGADLFLRQNVHFALLGDLAWGQDADEPAHFPGSEVCYF